MTDSAQFPKVPEVRTLLTRLGFGESPRWHEGRLWFSNWGMQEVVAVDLDGKSEIIVRVPTTIPFCIDWLHDGRLLVSRGKRGLSCVGSPTGLWRLMPTCAVFLTRAGMRSWWTAAATPTSMAAVPASQSLES